ncbi:histone deacetylase family protein [Thermaurantiacus sp.]
MFVFHQGYDPPGAPSGFPTGRTAAALAALRAHWPDLAPSKPMPAGRHNLLRVHAAGYVDAVLEARVPLAIERRIGFPVTPQMAARAELAVGGTIAAVGLALCEGLGINLAGGAHHAMPDGGAGYCVFNDLAVAAAWALDGLIERLLVIDLDVHQGDGTAVCLADVPGAFTFSLHAEKNFPARKARSSRDVALPDGTGDAAYLETLAAELPGLFDAARPDLVLVQAGVDVHAGDRLGRLALTDAGIAQRSALVRDACRAAGVPMAATMGGGYGDDPAIVGQRHAMALMHLAGARFPVGSGAAWA